VDALASSGSRRRDGRAHPVRHRPCTLAVALSFLVGTVILFATTAVVRRSMPELGPIMNAPWWMWFGGLLGAFFVCASIVLTYPAF